jgi:DNA polymerase III delta subunit
MEKKKNIISIHGRDRVGVRNELNRFINAFRERQSDANIEIITVDENMDFHSLEQMVLSVWLFAEKRLFVLKGNFVIKNERKQKEWKEKKADTRVENIINILEQIDDETFIIFMLEWDIPPWLENWLKQYADTRIFDQVFSHEAWWKRYNTLDQNDIEKVLENYEQIYALYEADKKPKNISYLIDESLEKLSLLEQSEPLTEEHLKESILLESSGKIFDLIDAILAGNRKKSLAIFHVLESETTMFSFLPGFIWLLRWSVYVRYLKKKALSEWEIQSIMKIHPYVLKKAINSAVSWESLRDFYDKIISINIAYRSGKWLHDPELWRIFWIERAIMSLKK